MSILNMQIKALILGGQEQASLALSMAINTNDGSIICGREMSGSTANGESNGKKRRRSTTSGSSGILGSRIAQDVE
jgi:hypothetical protein